MATLWLLRRGHTKVRTWVIDGPVSADRGPSPSLPSSFVRQTHGGILAALVCLCQKIWPSRTELAEKRTLKPSEDTPRGEFSHRWVVSLLISQVSHSEYLAAFFFFHTRPWNAWCHFSSLPYVSISTTMSILHLLARGDARLSIREFILAVSHSRGVFFRYRCATILTFLKHYGEESPLNQYCVNRSGKSFCWSRLK